MQTEIIAYNATEAAIAGLEAKYKDVVYDVTTDNGMADAKRAYKEINAHNIALEETRTREKAESLAYGRLVDAEAKRIEAKLDALRLPIKTMIESETKRVKREADEKQRLAMEAAIAADKAKKDAEEAELQRQRAEIAAAREAQAELERASRAKIEEEQRAARLKIEAEERAARLAREEADREARKLRDAEESRLKAERDRIEAAQRVVAEAQRKEREAAEAAAKTERDRLEAIEREEKRRDAELADADAMLATFRKRFGHMPRYGNVIEAIDTYLALTV